MKMHFKLIEVKNDHTITRSTDCTFLLLMQRAALLGLKSVGSLNEMQHRQAEEMLLKQYREDISVVQSDEDADS